MQKPFLLGSALSPVTPIAIPPSNPAGVVPTAQMGMSLPILEIAKSGDLASLLWPYRTGPWTYPYSATALVGIRKTSVETTANATQSVIY